MNDPVVQAAREAIAKWEEWLDADGIFPDPEYDDFHAAMNALRDQLYPCEDGVTP